MKINDDRIAQIAKTLDVPVEQLGHFIRAWRTEAHIHFINEHDINEVIPWVKSVLYGGIYPPRTFPVMKRSELTAGDWVETIDPEQPCRCYGGKLLGFDDNGKAVIKESYWITVHADVAHIMFATRTMERCMVIG